MHNLNKINKIAQSHSGGALQKKRFYWKKRLSLFAKKNWQNLTKFLEDVLGSGENNWACFVNKSNRLKYNKFFLKVSQKMS